MRHVVWVLLLSITTPAFAQQKEAFDFRGGRFDPDFFRLGGPTPEKFITQEAEGLRLRYTGVEVAPSNNPSAVGWKLWVRGNFVATARYEILKYEPPRKGNYYLGAELYLMLDNPSRDGVVFTRGLYPSGEPAFVYNLRTNDEKGKRITKDFKLLKATDKSLRGRLRLAREGTTVIASYAEGDDADFTEFQRSEIGRVDIRLVRLAAIAGGDRTAVLDMRVLDMQLEGDELSGTGRFLTPAPQSDAPKAKEDAAAGQAVPVAPALAPVPEERPTNSRSNLLLLIVVLLLLAIPAVGIVGVVLLLRRQKGGDKSAQKATQRPKSGAAKPPAAKAPPKNE